MPAGWWWLGLKTQTERPYHPVASHIDKRSHCNTPIYAVNHRAWAYSSARFTRSS